jgi:hypothetical protein
MTRRALRAAWCSALAMALCVALTACGGGGGGDDGNKTNTGALPTGSDTTSGGGSGAGTDTGTGSGPGSSPATPSDPISTTVTPPLDVTGSWTLQRLGTQTNQLFPGNTYQPIGGEYPYATWLGPDATSGQALYRADAGSAGLIGSTVQAGLPDQVSNNTTLAVTAGAWSMVVWARYGTVQDGAGLYVRLKGPAYDSGAVRVSDSARVTPWDTRPVIDAQGHARLYWDDTFDNMPTRLGRNVVFVGGRWVEQKDLDQRVQLAYQRLLVAPSGEGWWLMPEFKSDHFEHRAYRITAIDGLGASLRLDQTGSEWAGANGQLLGSADGNSANDLTAAMLQASADGSQHCLLVRRVVAGALKPADCIPASGEALPNGKYLSLATAPTGQGVLVWSTGPDNNALYVARRDAAGVWGAPAKLTDLPSSSSWDVLSGLTSTMGPQGQALVVWRESPFGGLSKAHARTAVAGGNWSVDTVLIPNSPTDVENRMVAVAFNTRGVPGVLQMTLTGTPQTGGNRWSIVMSSWVDGQWLTRTVAANIQPAYYNTIPVGLMRLAPSLDGGWLALWDQGKGPGDTTGYRELWAGQFH